MEEGGKKKVTRKAEGEKEPTDGWDARYESIYKTDQ